LNIDSAAVAGFSIGIAFVFAMAFIFNPSTNYENIEITGLKPVYHIGEDITFSEHITGFENDCGGFPDINIESVDHSHVIFTTYDRDGPVPSCSENFESNLPHTIDKEIKSQEFFSYRPITADKAGKYILTASYADGKMERKLTVVP
jgi:hypothetical protein